MKKQGKRIFIQLIKLEAALIIHHFHNYVSRYLIYYYYKLFYLI